MSLIVEDGTGLATAESYISVVDFRLYHANRGNVVPEGETEIERILRVATEYIDLRFGLRFPGYLVDEDQALCFPRTYFSELVPLGIERATSEYGFYQITNPLFITPAMDEGDGIIRKLEVVGPITEETEYSGSGKGGSSARKFAIVPKGDMWISRYVLGGGGGVSR